jgi:hypothetical protein
MGSFYTDELGQCRNFRFASGSQMSGMVTAGASGLVASSAALLMLLASAVALFF